MTREIEVWVEGKAGLRCAEGQELGSCGAGQDLLACDACATGLAFGSG